MKSKIQEYLDAGHSLDCILDTEIDPNLKCTCGLDAALAEFERLKALVHAARETRKAQRTYFDGGKLSGDLVKAKQWEKDLDKRLAGLWAQTPAEGTTQERLL